MLEGRFEVGFPRRWWPDNVEPIPDIDLRWVSDEQLSEIIAHVQGRSPVYRSVYRFRDPEEGVRPRERKSAIITHIFNEFEDHACGELCQHTMLAVRRFGHWLKRNRMYPQVIYSGGKSLHVYTYCPEVTLRTPHETVQSVNEYLIQKARVQQFWDSRANLALSQIARVPNALNPKTGLYAIPVSFEDVVRRPVSYILKLAEQPQPMQVAPAIPSPVLSDALKQRDEYLTTKEAIERLLPPPRIEIKGECAHLKRVLKQGVADGQGRHFALVAVIDHYRAQGLTEHECVEQVKAWNTLNRPPVSPGAVRHQVRAQYSRSGDVPPACALLRSKTDLHKGNCK